MSDTPNQRVELANEHLRVAIETLGAQMVSMRTIDGQELIWQGDPPFWNKHAPILFPVIGPVPEGQILHGGQRYPMPTHGFARDSDFTVVEREASRAVFELRDSEQTRSYYPFAFSLKATYALVDTTLECTVSVENMSDEPLPADVGFHPGFNWPLTPGLPRDSYAVVFTENEPAPIRRGVENPIFLTPDDHPTAVEGDTFRPRSELFEDNAIVFDQVRSRSVRFGPVGDDVPADATVVDVAFPDSPFLAIWTQPGAPFLCIEPWQGLPSPVGFDGQLSEKPGIAITQPGETRRWRLQVTVSQAKDQG